MPPFNAQDYPAFQYLRKLSTALLDSISIGPCSLKAGNRSKI